MGIWIPVTIAAACFQTARTAMQQRLRTQLSVSGAGFVRYLYGAPLAIVAVGVVALIDVVPSPPWRFWPTVAAAGLAQIVGTVFMIRAFDTRDFAIGTVYTKTEVVQVAVWSTVVLGEPLGVLGWLATFVCFAGVVVLAGGRRVLHVRDRAAVFGVLAGGSFALASVGIRAASQSLLDGLPGASGTDHALARALLTLAVMNTMQTLMHGGWLAWRDRGQLRLAVVHWRSSSIVGVLSVCGSACWALAFTLENAARVRTFGQLELLVTFVVAHVWLGERHGRREYVASALVLLGVVGVLAGG